MQLKINDSNDGYRHFALFQWRIFPRQLALNGLRSARMAVQSKYQSVAQRDTTLPPAVPVQVQCEGFRCLAYRDQTGAWVDYHTGKPLVGEVRLIEYSED